VAVAKVDRPLKDREYFRSAIAVEMAERAVEEHRFGNGRGTVASGHIFDVSVKIAEEMVKTWRLCEDAPYSTAGFESSREINEHVERELKFAYSLALSAIKRHYRVVKEVAGRLIKKGEMTGGEFYAIINQDEDLGAAHRFIRQANS
jgi:ATP-dependent Zn protease